jgi:hypothetical protein
MSVIRSAVTAIAVLVFSLVGVPAASADTATQTPQQVADYFAHGLIPRLIDLYGSGDGVTSGIDFDATTKVGGISRVLEWTPDFLAGKQSDELTRVTNNWVASVSVRGAIIGLATVWINPATELSELASFDPPALATQLAAAPADSLLVHDPPREAWLAINGDTLIPLVAGTSGATSATTPSTYQRLITTVAPVQEKGFSGVAISALVLGVVILGLAIFVLLPVGKRGAKELPEPEADQPEPEPKIDEPEPEPQPEPEPEPEPQPEKKQSEKKQPSKRQPAKKQPEPVEKPDVS